VNAELRSNNVIWKFLRLSIVRWQTIESYYLKLGRVVVLNKKLVQKNEIRKGNGKRLGQWWTQSDDNISYGPFVKWLLFYANSAIFRSSGENNFQWNDDDVRFALDQHA
jgi:hypothetical protein